MTKAAQGKESAMLGDDETVWLQIGFKQVPEHQNKARRIPLPHSLYDSPSCDICLITKDLPKDEQEALEEAVKKGCSSHRCDALHAPEIRTPARFRHPKLPLGVPSIHCCRRPYVLLRHIFSVVTAHVFSSIAYLLLSPPLCSPPSPIRCCHCPCVLCHHDT